MPCRQPPVPPFGRRTRASITSKSRTFSNARECCLAADEADTLTSVRLIVALGSPRIATIHRPLTSAPKKLKHFPPLQAILREDVSRHDGTVIPSIRISLTAQAPVVS